LGAPSNQDQGEEKSRVPRCQKFENSDLIVDKIFLQSPAARWRGSIFSLFESN
jgi:hypothetical protein